EMVRNKLTSTERMAITDQTYREEDMVSTVMNADAESVKETLAGLDKTSFHAAVEALLEAGNIYVIGVRSSSAPASFLAFYLNLMLPGVKQISSNTASEVFEQLLHAGKGDVVVGISYPRYSRRTIKAMRLARAQGARTIAITDSRSSPLAEEADLALLAKGEMVSFVDSLIAPMSLINALIVAVGMRRKDDVYANFEKLEKVWEEYEVYEKIK
ncbi:MAG: MurR/RpiR family transcriptional regulator, partial [Clostridia bacterium]|nr:MurR/RpiR family transcriptional regulator [Clostridia bacterium]